MNTARIVTGDRDAIIVAHSSFERIGMSRGFRGRVFREPIKEYEGLLIDESSSSRSIIKTIGKQKSRREEWLKERLAEDKEDDALIFGELGLDQFSSTRIRPAKISKSRPRSSRWRVFRPGPASVRSTLS